MKALVKLHQAMPHEPLQRLRTAMEMACDRGAFIRHRRLFLSGIIVAKDHVMIH